MIKKDEKMLVEATPLETVFRTDIYLISAMLTHGCMLERSKIDRSDRRHIKIAVTGSNLDALENAWYANELGGNLRDYAAHLKDVKALLHES